MKISGRNCGWPAVCLLACLWLAASGCQTYSGPPEKNLAVVTITNRPLADVQKSVVKVFHAHGFTGGPAVENRFIFTRTGTYSDRLVYGSYVFGEAVTVKVTVITRTLPDGAIAMTGNAWMDAGEDDPVFEGDHKATPLRKGPYQSLLQEVKKDLGE
jgi:hypothetical protein